MSNGADDAVTTIGQYLAERISETEKQSETAGTSLRETAKWIVSGIAVATAGVIAGTSLSSLGALGLGGRFYVAIAAAVLGYLGLGYLFATALAVIVPKDHTLQEIADGTGISARWQREMEEKLKPLLFPENKFKTLKEFCDYAEDPKNANDVALAGHDLVTFNMARRWIGARAKSVERELQFRRLKVRTFVITPLIAMAFIGFSWAANPAKEERVPVMEKVVDVNPDDVPALRSAFASTACLPAKLHVIVLAEWPSGVQDVVTIPAPSCPPVRLRLDHGRFSKAQ